MYECRYTVDLCLASAMIKLKYERIILAAVHTRMRLIVVPDELAIALTVSIHPFEDRLIGLRGILSSAFLAVGVVATPVVLALVKVLFEVKDFFTCPTDSCRHKGYMTFAGQ